MRAWIFAAALLVLAPSAYGDEPTTGSLDFSRLTKPQEEFFWQRLRSLANEEAVLAYCGQPDDFATRAIQGIRACVTAAAMQRAESFFNTELKSAEAALHAKKASCKASPVPTRGWLGVELGSAAGGGAPVSGAVADSPAASAGLKAGDVIAKVNGEAVVGPKELSAKIRALKPGADVKLDVSHDGVAREVSVKLGAMAFDADGRIALDLPALAVSSRDDLKRVADEVTDMCVKCKTTVWAMFCR